VFHSLRPLVIGIVHGLAGSACRCAAGADHHSAARRGAIIYLLIFGLGTVAGMMLITAAIACLRVFDATFYEIEPRPGDGFRLL